MRILYVGLLWEGGTCLQRMVALRELGHEVTGVDTTPPERKAEWRLHNRVLNRLGFPPDLAGANRRAVEVAARGGWELLWVDGGRTIRPATLEAFRRANPGAPVVSYTLDDMMNPRNQSRAYLASLPAYDLHVTTKTYNVAELKALGARDVLFSGNAYDPRTHRPMELSAAERKRWGAEAAFVGQYERDRFEQILALAEAGVEVSVWGPDWETRRAAHPRLRVREAWVGGDDYARVVSAARVNLGFLRKANRDQQTTRSVEIPACGGFLLAERTPEHLALFAEGREAEYFASTDELVAKARHYLEHEDERRRVAAAGRERCLRDGYSYRERLRAVFAYLERVRAGGGAPRARAS